MPSRPPVHRPVSAARPRTVPRGPRHYDTRRWRRLSAAKRAANPVCEVCAQEPSAHVHHKRPLDMGGEDTWDNLQAVCHGCHSTIQAEADRAAAAFPGAKPCSPA